MSISEIEWYHWVNAFFLVTLLLIAVISIPSFYSIYKFGYKDYVRNIKLLYTLYSKVTISYYIESSYTQNFQWPDGSIKSFSSVKSNYYFPIYINDKKVFIVDKTDKVFSSLRVNDSNYDGDEWVTDLIEIKTNTCLLTQILKDRFEKKISRLSEESVRLDDINNLNDLINSEIKSIRRHGKLNQILPNG